MSELRLPPLFWLNQWIRFGNGGALALNGDRLSDRTAAHSRKFDFTVLSGKFVSSF